METWIVSSFPGPISRVMALLFKTVVNIGLLLPIYFAPADFYCMMCGLIVSRAVILLTLSFFPPDLMCFFCLRASHPSVRVQPSGLAFRAGPEGTLMWRICNWSPLPGEWCHYDRDGQLRPDWRQDLRCWPVPDGERPMLPPRRLQDYITKVKKKQKKTLSWKGGSYFTNTTRSWGLKVRLSFFGFFPFPPLSAPDVPLHKRTVKIIAPLVQPPPYRTINRHLTPS